MYHCFNPLNFTYYDGVDVHDSVNVGVFTLELMNFGLNSCLYIAMVISGHFETLGI